MKSTTHPLPSLRKDLVRTLLVISGFWLVAVFVAVTVGVRHEIDDLMDSALQESAELLYGMVWLRDMELPLAAGGILPAPPHDEGLVWQIVNQGHNRVLARSHQAPERPLLPVFQEGLSNGPGGYRVYAMRLPREQQVLYVGQPEQYRVSARQDTIVVVGVGGLLVGLLCAFWMQWRVNALMRPLGQLSRDIQQYDPMQSDVQLRAATQSELVEIREAILELGRRLARRVHSEQAFAAHAAHALRTPLAGMDVQLAVALKEVPEEHRSRIQLVREASARLKHVIGSLLTLFRSQSALDVQAVQLADLVRHLQLGVDALQVHVEQNSPLYADTNLLAGVLANLLDNAQRYGARHCWITSERADAWQTVRIRDDGPGVHPSRLHALAQAANGGTEDGFVGLGLKLAALVARAHGGHIELGGGESAGQGFSVTLWLKRESGL